jgi:adenine-specific DNA methylase
MDVALIPEQNLLEAGALPFGDLVRFAAREGRRPRPIYQIHKWFARRLGCSFRALLVGAVSEPATDFWKAYYNTGNLQGFTVLDPFVGGGTSVVEAARLGASAIGVDVDPIACAVTTAELTAAKLEDLLPTLRILQERVGRTLAPLHTLRGPTGTRFTAVHYFWVQVVACPSCQKVGEAHPNYVLAEETGQKRWAFCRKCHEPHALKASQKSFRCRSCETKTVLDSAPVRYGTYTCPHCEESTPLITLGREAQKPPTWRLFAIEATPRTTGRSVPMKERVFLKATAARQAAFTRASKALRKELEADPDFLPRHDIEEKQRADSRLTDYGYRRWSQLFNDRQLLHLGRLAREIKKLSEDKRCAIGLAFSNHLTTNCMLTSYAAGWRRLTPIFSIRAFRHVPRPVELNPWLEGTGRGTFPNAIRQVLRASAFAKAPKEPARRGGFRDVEAVVPTTAPRVFSGNARELTDVESNSVDMVLTDPPYFDNITYSELSDFFQPWLEHMGLVPEAAKRLALVKRALRARRNNEESIEEFAANLGEAFGEVHRVLKPQGLLAFTFRHSTPEGWLAMAKALARSRLKPMQVLPMPGEAGIGLHTHDGTSLWDAVLVFRKCPTTAPTESVSDQQAAAARADAGRWRDRFRRQDRLPFNDADFANLCRASLVAASLGLYGDGTSTGIGLRTALEDVVQV